MKNFLTTGLLAGLFLAVTLTSAHANEPEQSAQRCDARRVTYLIGEYLSRSVRDEAFRESRATSIIAACRGAWEVLEPCRKIYVVLLQKKFRSVIRALTGIA